MNKKSWVLLLQITWVIVVVSCMATIIVLKTYKASSPDILITYWGTILGGVFAGVFTVLGVLLTLWWSQRQENRHTQDKLAEQIVRVTEENGRKINRLRLVMMELSQNKRLIETAISSNDWHLIETLKFSIWQQINLEMDWLDSELFKDLFDVYSTLEQISYYVRETLRDPLGLSVVVNQSTRWKTYPTIIDGLFSRVENVMSVLKSPPM